MLSINRTGVKETIIMSEKTGPSIHGVTVSVSFGDKQYGNGDDRFFSSSFKVPEGEPGVPLDQAMQDGIDMYFNAWQALMQTRYATGSITAQEYKQQTVEFISRISKIGALYAKIKSKSVAELDAYLAKQRGNNDGK